MDINWIPILFCKNILLSLLYGFYNSTYNTLYSCSPRRGNENVKQNIENHFYSYNQYLGVNLGDRDHHLSDLLYLIDTFDAPPWPTPLKIILTQISDQRSN